MNVTHLALVSLTPQINASDLALTAAALQKQITRDLGPLWGLDATISAFPDLQSVPVGYWPITISADAQIDQNNDEGYHWSDTANLPFAIVKYDPTWQLTSSHEMCEMLVDPYGYKTITSDCIPPGQGRVNYLVEVCDPCEDASFGYTVDGILMSDFYTPNYFDPVSSPATRYSFTGAVTTPKQVLKNGYLTWNDPSAGKWMQANYFYDQLQINDVTAQMQGRKGPIRSRVDRITKNVDKLDSYKAAIEKRAFRQPAFAASARGYQHTLIAEIDKFFTHRGA
jgi:hypothetical protein